VIREWVAKWRPMAAAAIEGYCAALPDSPEAAADATAAIDSWMRSIDVTG
jgi:toluene monooxygenase system protein E